MDAVSLWPLTDTPANAQTAVDISVWLHTTSTYTSSSAVLCGTRAKLYTVFENYIQCQTVTSGTKFVTVQRVGTAPVALHLQEVRVYRACEWLQAMMMSHMNAL